MPSHWTEYLVAAHRKVDIAAFHCEQLKSALGRYNGSFDGCPTIPIQAYFEGTVVAAVSAIDQVAQAANSALELRLRSEDLFDCASSQIERRVPAYRNWRDQPIGVDLRRLRTRIVHYSYTKSSSGDLKWEVETVNGNYAGARDLSAYAEAVVVYCRELAVIADELRESFAANNPVGAVDARD
jgi:hypothetical protein